MSEMLAPPLPPIFQTAVDWMLKIQNYFTELRQFHEDEEDREVIAQHIELDDARERDPPRGPPSTIAGWTFLFRQMEVEKRRLAQ